MTFQLDILRLFVLSHPYTSPKTTNTHTHTQKNKCIQPYVKYIDGLLKGETIICNAAGFNYSIFFKLFRANELIPK